MTGRRTKKSHPLLPPEASPPNGASSPERTTAAEGAPDSDLPLTMSRPTIAPAAEPTALAGLIAALPCALGRYQLLKQLGQGGMGTVYLAHDPLLERRIALKVPHADVLRSPHALERFHREATS